MTGIYQNLNINPISFRSSSVTTLNSSNPIDNQSRNFDSSFYVDKKGAEAIKSKNFVANPIEVNKPISMNDYKNKLIKAGLVEGKDFDVIQISEKEGASIFITKGQDKLHKVVHWNDGIGAENYDGYTDIVYPIKPNDVSQISYRYDAEGYLEDKGIEYNNPDEHKDLFPKNIDINTSPKEYAKMLDSKNIKYEIEKTSIEDRGTMTSIYEFDNNGKEKNTVKFFEYPNGDKMIFSTDIGEANGLPIRQIDLVKFGDRYSLQVTEFEKNKGNKIKNTVKY